MTGAAVLAVISFLGIVTAALGVGYVSLGIRRDDRRGITGRAAGQYPAGLSRASRVARQATGVRGFSARL